MRQQGHKGNQDQVVPTLRSYGHWRSSEANCQKRLRYSTSWKQIGIPNPNMDPKCPYANQYAKDIEQRVARQTCLATRYRIAAIWAVIVVPILEPKISATAVYKSIRPLAPRAMTIPAQAELLLDEHRHQNADANGAKNCPRRKTAVLRSAIESLEKGDELLVLSQNFQLRTHDAHAKEKKPETQNGIAPATQGRMRDKAKQHTNGNRRHDQPADIEGYQLRSNRGTDIGAENSRCLQQVEIGLMKPTTITVVALEDWMTAVTSVPDMIATKRFEEKK